MWVVIVHYEACYRKDRDSDDSPEFFSTYAEAREYLTHYLRDHCEERAACHDEIAKNEPRRWDNEDGFIKEPWASNFKAVCEELKPFNVWEGDGQHVVSWQLYESSTPLPEGQGNALPCLIPALLDNVRWEAGRARLPTVLLDLIVDLHQAMPNDEDVVEVQKDVPEWYYNSDSEDEEDEHEEEPPELPIPEDAPAMAARLRGWLTTHAPSSTAIVRQLNSSAVSSSATSLIPTSATVSVAETPSDGTITSDAAMVSSEPPIPEDAPQMAARLRRWLATGDSSTRGPPAKKARLA